MARTKTAYVPTTPKVASRSAAAKKELDKKVKPEKKAEKAEKPEKEKVDEKPQAKKMKAKKMKAEKKPKAEKNAESETETETKKKRTRKASMYNVFMKYRLADMKADSDIMMDMPDHKDRFKAAAGEWKNMNETQKATMMVSYIGTDAPPEHLETEYEKMKKMVFESTEDEQSEDENEQSDDEE